MLEYPWNPYETIYPDDIHTASPTEPTGGVTSTLEEARKLLPVIQKYAIDRHLYPQMNDLIHLAIENSLNHTTDAETVALADARIPSASDHNNTLRFLIAFMYEIQLGYQSVVDDSIIVPIRDKYWIYPALIHPYLAKWNGRAAKIVEIMDDASAKVGSALAQNPDFIRNAALIELGDKTGLELTSKANAISFSIGETSDQGNKISRTLAANTSFYMVKASDFRIAGTRANNTDTLTLTSKNGPNEITVTTNRVPVKSVLAKNTSKVLVNAELMGSVVSTQPILLPIANRTLPNITDLEVDEVQSVNIDGLFTSIRGNVTAHSANTRVATVSVNSGQTSMGVTGRSTGTAKITVTDTNEAGSTNVSFDLTVIAASD